MRQFLFAALMVIRCHFLHAMTECYDWEMVNVTVVCDSLSAA